MVNVTVGWCMAVGCAGMPLVYRGMAAECPNDGSVRLQGSALSVR